MPQELKRCSKCKESKPAKLVSTWNQTNHGGVVSICRDCAVKKQRKYRKTGRGRIVELEASKRAYQNHKEKWIARAKLRYAVLKGIIAKPSKCEVCAERKPLQGHHEDYSKPLQVIWLCSGCHADADRELKKSKK